MRRITELTCIGFVFASILISACQKTSTTVNTSNAVNENKPTNAAPATSATAETSQPSAQTAGSPTDVYKLAYKYRNEKNIEGLKSVFSKDVLEFFTEIGKEEKKSLDDEIRSMTEKPQWKTDESRNEKINGDRATIEYRDEDGEWKTMDFVKENGQWKLGFPGKEGPDERNP